MRLTKRGPLRKIIGFENGREILECGHVQAPLQDAFGRTEPVRRRCMWCYKNGKVDMAFFPKLLEQKTLLFEDTNCWVWQGATASNGYGSIVVAGNTFLVHRLVWKLHNGDIPDGMHILHTCDRPICCNIDHLFIGTHADNMTDKAQKGRSTQGEKQPNAKLTDDKVLEIRQKHNTGTKQADLAREYGVSYQNIHHIVHRMTWAHI